MIVFHVFGQQIYILNFLWHVVQSLSPQNTVCFIELSFLVHEIFNFDIKGVLKCRCATPGPKGKIT